MDNYPTLQGIFDRLNDLDRNAADYKQQYALLKDAILAELQALQAQVQPQRTRGKRRPVTPAGAKVSETIDMRADIINQSLIHALRRDDMYAKYPEQQLVEYSQPFGTGKD